MLRLNVFELLGEYIRNLHTDGMNKFILCALFVECFLCNVQAKIIAAIEGCMDNNVTAKSIAFTVEIC